MIAEKIHISEIIGYRFDNSYVLYQHKMSNYKYPVVPLYKFLQVKPQYGAGEAGMPRIDITSPRYIRITDIDENGCLSKDIGVTAKIVEEKYILNNNDILIARSGNTVGKSYIHKTSIVQDTCFYAGYLIRFVVDAEKILPDYVYILTKLSPYANWVKVTQRVTGQPNINAEEYGNLPIPLPPIEIQQRIVDIYIQAQKERNIKYQAAKQQLACIDDYLIDILNIGKRTALLNKLQYIKISLMIGERFDVPFQKEIEKVTNSVKAYPHKTLGEIVQFSSEGWDQKSVFEDVFPYIEIGSVDTSTGDLNKIDIVPIDKAPSRAKKIVRTNDILISTTRPNRGAICVYKKNNIAVASTGFSIVRGVSDCILREYLYCVLRSSLSLDQMAVRSSGGNYPAIIESELKKVLIPLPPLAIQKNIVSTIEEIKLKVKQLQKEGDESLETVKRKIEKLISE